METSFEVTYRAEVIRDDLPRIDTAWQRAILGAIEEKLMTHPDFYGKPLRDELKGCWKLRVGDYRVVFQLQGRTVHIIAVVHRSHDYQGVTRRFKDKKTT